MKIRVSSLQFERAGKYKRNIERARKFLKELEKGDYALIGGEFSLNESKNTDPYPDLIQLARDFQCNIVAPINANLRRFPDLEKSREKGYSSTHIFNRMGEVVAIQDKQHFYWKELAWFKRGTDIKVFEVDGVKIGLVRGLDMLYPEFTRQMEGAEVIFFSTMATDNMMLEIAKTRATENQCYVVMSSFIGDFVGSHFIGNAAIIEPEFLIRTGMKMAKQPRVLQHTTEENFIQADLDIDYIRAIRKEYPMGEM